MEQRLAELLEQWDEEMHKLLNDKLDLMDLNPTIAARLEGALAERIDCIEDLRWVVHMQRLRKEKVSGRQNRQIT